MSRLMCRRADAGGRPRRWPESRPLNLSTGLARPWWSLNHDRGRVPPMRHRNLAGSRDSGLRRLSRLTFRATLLSVVTAFGMATLLAKTAHSEAGASVGAANTSPAGQQGASTGPSPAASGKPGKASPSPSASASASGRTAGTKSKSAAAHQRGAVAPSATASSQPAPAPAKSSAPAPKPTIAPPTTAPAPAPSSAPAPTPTSTSHPA